MKQINQGIKLPSKNKEIDFRDIIDYWSTSIKEDLNCLSFLNIIEYMVDRI